MYSDKNLSQATMTAGRHFIFLAAMLLTSGFNEASWFHQEQGEIQEIGCRVRDSNMTGSSTVFSNLERILLELRYNQTQPDLAKVELMTGMIEDQETAEGARIIIEAFQAEGGTPVPLETSVTGVSLSLNVQRLRLWMELPLEAEEEQRLIDSWTQKAIDYLKEHKPENVSNEELERRAMADYLKPHFVQNRVGSFDIHCGLVDSEGKRIEAEPVRIEIEFQGNFFDRPEFMVPEKEQ